MDVKFDTNVHFIYGQTGSGKTLNLVNRAVEHLTGNPESNKVIVCCFANMGAVEHGYEQILKKSIEIQGDDKTKYIKKRLVTYTSGSKKSFILGHYHKEKMKGKDFIIPRVIITTHAYLQLRGDSFVLYQFVPCIYFTSRKQIQPSGVLPCQ